MKGQFFTQTGRGGFTLIELLTVLAVIGLLAALLLPAIASARESARRATCTNHLHQIGVALSGFESQHGRFPAGPLHKFELLPFLELSSLRKTLLEQAGSDSEYWAPAEGVVVDVYLCPSDGPEFVGSGGISATNYAGCFGTGMLAHGENGFFEVERCCRSRTIEEFRGLRPGEILDGLSTTTAMAEILHGDGTWHRLRTVWQTPVVFWDPAEQDALADYCDAVPVDPRSLGWLGDRFRRGVTWYEGDRGAGLYNHLLTPNRPSCTNGTHVPTGTYTAASAHPGGVSVLYADGRVAFASETIDRTVWREMGARNDMLGNR